MPDPDTLLWGMIFGAIGLGYFVYGKNQGRMVMMLLGAALCVFPYIVTGLLPLCLIGAVRTLLPFFLKNG